MIISVPFGGAAGSTLLDSITYRAAYAACAPSTNSVTAVKQQYTAATAESAEPEHLVRVVDDVEDDGEWDIPLVPHIIGLRSAAVAKDADAATLSIDQPDMDDALAQQQSSPANPNAAAETGAPAPLSRDSPTEDQIAAHWVVAEPLGEWAAKYLWASCSGAFAGHKQLFAVNDTPKDLPKRIQVVLQRALLTPTAVLVAIYYARRLPGAFNAHLNTHPGSLESAFALDLYRGGLEMGVFKLFCVGAMLANKTLDDNTYTNKAWRDMAEISLFELNNFEMQALGIFSYRLHIQPSEWTDFAAGVLAYHSATSSPPLPPIGAACVPTPHSIVLNAFKEITKAVAQPTTCTYARHAPSSNSPSKKQVPNPFFYGQEEAKAVKARFYAQEEEIDNFDLDADGPLKDEYVPNRMRSKSEAAATFAVKEKENVKDVVVEVLPKPAKWSPADDPVVERQVIGCGVTKQQRGSFVAPATGPVPPPPPPADKGMKNNNSNPGPVMARDIFAMTLQQSVVPGPRTSISGPPPTSFHPFGDSPEGHQYVLPPPAYGYGPRSVPPPPPPQQQQQQPQGPPPHFYQPAHPPPGYAFGPYQPCAAPTFWDAPPPHVFDHRGPPPPMAFHPAPPPMNAPPPPPQHQMPRRATVPTIMPHYAHEMGAVQHMPYPQPQLHHIVHQQQQQQHLPLHHRLAPPFHHQNHPSAFAAFGPSLIRA